MSARFAAALAFLACALGAGCSSTHTHARLGTAIDQTERRAAIPVPALLASRRLPAVAIELVLPATATAELAVGPTPAEEVEPMPFDAAVLGDELVEALAATHVFESVIPLDRPTRGPRDRYAAEADARSRDASLLIEAVIERPRLVRTDREFVTPLIAWLFSFPALWVHSHTYRLEFGLQLRLHDLNTGEILPEKPLEPARFEEELNFHERVSSVWTYLLTNIFPPPFLPEDENKVARGLATAALTRPLGQFLDRLAEAFKGEVYSFAIQPKEGGPPIRVRYPPVGKPLYLLKRTVRLSVVVEAPQGETISEVRLAGRVVFPARSAVGAVVRRRVRLEVPAHIDEGQQILLEAKDSKGRGSACLIVPAREREVAPAAREAEKRK